MTDKWIVTQHDYMKHPTLEKARAEQARLAESNPGREFRIHRIKATLTRGQTTRIIKAAEAFLAEESEANRDVLAHALKALLEPPAVTAAAPKEAAE